MVGSQISTQRIKLLRNGWLRISKFRKQLIGEPQKPRRKTILSDLKLINQIKTQ